MAFPRLRSRERFFRAKPLSRKVKKKKPRINTNIHECFLRSSHEAAEAQSFFFECFASLREHPYFAHERRFCFSRERPAGLIITDVIFVAEFRHFFCAALLYFAGTQLIFDLRAHVLERRDSGFAIGDAF